MIDDPIVEEVHRIREQIMARYNGDLDAYVKDLQRRTEERAQAGHKMLSVPSRPTAEEQRSKKAG
ncbi:MAG TPA: hypothetical protein VFE58_02310 [Tepidisphaeraceae bacterium]|jgi:hypothetical protein|nr:hypothetical protein [Tepidisphaeraceae bacterium]